MSRIVALQANDPQTDHFLALSWPPDKPFTTLTILHQVNLLLTYAEAKGFDMNGTQLEWVKA